MKTTVVEFEQFAEMDFQPPATYYVRTAMCYIYLHTRKRNDAQEYVDSEYGVGKYTVRSSKLTKSQPKYEGHSISAKG